MTVFNDKNKLRVDCSEATIIPFDFKIFKDTDLRVSLINKETSEETILNLNTDYKVNISRIKDGGEIVLNEAHAGYDLFIYREIPIIQPEKVPTEGAFPEKTIEDALDRATMIAQQLKEQTDRCVQIPPYSSGETGGNSTFEDVISELPPPIADNVLAWDSQGKKLENYDVKKEIDDFKNAVGTTISNAENNFQGQINTFTKDVNEDLSTYKNDVNSDIEKFKNDINTTISEVSEAAQKVNELENAVQTAVDKASAAAISAEDAGKQADRAESIASELDSFKNSFPAVVNLTTWARLNDGEIYNIPFDDVKADTNRFIAFKNTGDRRTLILKKNTFIKLETTENVRHLCVWEDTDLNVEALLDTGETLVNGKDYSIFLVPEGDSGVALKVSLNKTAPVGYNTRDTRRIGGFHTLCVAAGIINGHDLSGWLAGDILPLSVWTLWHKPAVASPSGMRYVPERDGWKTIYMQSGTGKNTVFEYGATHTRSRDYWGHEFDVGVVGLELISSINFTVSAQGAEPLKVIKEKAENSCLTAGGHVNESGRRILSNGGDEDDVGVLSQVLSHVSAAGTTNPIWNKVGSFNDTKAWQAHNVHCLMAGGSWHDSGYAGPSCRDGGHPASNLGAFVSARGWSRPYRPCA